jgi:GT2 family glycosyltransferase
MNPSVSIVIPTMDRQHILRATLESLFIATAEMDAEIIVVNDSKTQTVVIDDPDVTVLNNPKQGAASARNFGFRHAKGALVLFLDDDMLLSSTVLHELIRRTQENEKTIFLPNWHYPETISRSLNITSFGRFLLHIRYDSLRGWINNERAWGEAVMPHDGIASYCLLLRRDAFETTGGYNEAFPFAGFEDYDLTQRLIQHDFRFFILTKHTILHNETDRIRPIDFLNRKRRNANTQRKAVDLGYAELVIPYSFPRRCLLHTCAFASPVLLFLSRCIPNTRFFDFLYRPVIKLLIATYIYLGYSIDYEKQKGPDA